MRPWRAYGEVDDSRLRSSILDFYEDLLLGNKPGLLYEFATGR